MDLQHRLRAQVRRHARPSDIRFGVARLRSTSDWSVLPDRRSVRSGAARLRSTSDSRFHPILVPEVIAVVIEPVLERVSAAIECNAALLCAIFARLKTHANRGAATEGDCKWTVGDGNWSPCIECTGNNDSR